MNKLLKYIPYAVMAFVVLVIAWPLLRQSGQLFLPDHVLREGISVNDLSEMKRGASFPVYYAMSVIGGILSISWGEKLFLLLVLLLPLISMWLFLRNKVGMYLALLGGVLFLWNPFMYERFMSGQWFVMLGVAYLPILLLSFDALYTGRTRKHLAYFALVFALYPFVSVHYAYIGTIILLCYALVRYSASPATRPKGGEVVRVLAVTLATFLVVNAFWLANFFAEVGTYNAIDQRDFGTFVTKGDPIIGVFPNVLFGYGFWREGVILPKDALDYWWLPSVILWLFAFLGLVSGVKRRDPLAMTLAGLLPLVWLLAVGMATPVTASVTNVLYSYFPGWNGLRETAKLGGVLMLILALYAPQGLKTLLSYFQASKVWERGGALMLAFLGLVTAFTFLWGGMGQLALHEYPQSWHDANRVIVNAPDRGKVLVFPWRGYLMLDWAGNTYVANPAEAFFSFPVEMSRSTGNVLLDEKYASPFDPVMTRILDVSSERGEQVVALRAMGVTHIVVLKTQDWERYRPFLEDEMYAEKLFDQEEIALYRLK